MVLPLVPLAAGVAAGAFVATRTPVSETQYCEQRHSCDGPDRCAFYAGGSQEKGQCFTSEADARAEGCPPGWRFLKTTSEGCDPSTAGLIGEAVGIEETRLRPLCERTAYAYDSDAEKRTCCLQNTSNDPGCPPQFCKAKINEPPCFALLESKCLKHPRDLFFDPQCQQFVLDEATRGGERRKAIAAAVTSLCKQAGRFGAAHPLCQCVLSTEEGFCLENDCFARQNSALKELSICLDKRCVKPDKGVFVPPPPEGGCPSSVCAPLLQLKCVNLSSEEAINFIVQCAEEMTPAQREEFKQRYNVTDRDIDRAKEQQQRGILGPQTGGASGGAKGNGNANQQEGDEKPIDPVLLAAIIGGAVIGVVILVIVVVAVASAPSAAQPRQFQVQQQQQPSPQYFAPPPQFF